MSAGAKKIGFIGNPPMLEFRSKDNTGNIIHGYAARSIFKDPLKISTATDTANIAQIREKCTHLGFVTATMLHVNKAPAYIASHEAVAEFIEKLNLPVCTFGFGCQAPLGQSIASSEVDPRSIRLLRAISNNAKTIAVRGEFTADLCNKYGVKNVEIVGCQSAYVAGLNNWNKKTFVKKDTRRSVAYVSPGSDERELLRLILASGSELIGQSDPTEEAIKLGEITREEYSAVNSKCWTPQYLQKFFAAKGISRAEYFDYIRAHFFKFYNVPDWMEHIRTNYDFCYGTRFHGNMVALMAGVPALWIKHDMRTEELCNHLNLPAIYHSDLQKFKSLQDLLDQCDYSKYWAKFPERMATFVKYLKDNQVHDLAWPELANKMDRVISGQ